LPLGSVFDRVVGFFTGAVKDVYGAITAGLHAVEGVWSFLVALANTAWGAWDWVVNGCIWIGKNIEDWAGYVYNTLGHILLHVIPEAATWAYRHSLGAAIAEAVKLFNTAKKAVENAIKWAERELAKLGNLIDSKVKAVIRWVTGAVNWVEKIGKKVGELVEHPELLVKWIFAHMVLALVREIIKGSILVMAIIFKAFHSLATEIVSEVEDLLAKVI
jgi:hypothetical protein